MELSGSALNNLARLRYDVRRERLSSWDRTGGNKDFRVIEAGERSLIVEISGAGCVKDLWMTMSSPDPHYARKVILRMWWDDEPHEIPSVETPIVDFFGIGHGIVKNF